jgi:glucose/arabinose dehydrogenase
VPSGTAGASGSLPTGSPTVGASAPHPTTPRSGSVRLVRIATLDTPLAMAVRPGDPALYVAERSGRIVALRGGKVNPSTILDISGRITSGGEQGMLGLAFSPDGRFLYVSYTDTAGDSNVDEYPFAEGKVSGPRRLVLFVHQPFSNHNGGNLAFGPDGDLHIGLGDGGSEGDPMRTGQSTSTLLGKMLRIDPRPSGGAAYTVPRDNPFTGHPGIRPEIWSLGLRNPWRYSFDWSTGDLWIGDVGQNQWEEIDFQPAGSRGGQNYGWSRMEGTHVYNGPAMPTQTAPVYEYSHAGGGCAVTGGYVYRGAAMPWLAGAYLFGDFCLGQIMALRTDGGRVSVRPLGLKVPALASFGQDQAGELYALSLSGNVYRLAP